MAEGGLPVPADDAPRSCQDWLSIEPQEFTLEPKKGVSLTCRVRAPRNAVGGYYGVISVTAAGSSVTSLAEEDGVAAGVRFRHRNLVPVLITVPGPGMEAIIESAPPMLVTHPGSPGYSLELPLRNTGNMHARIHGTAQVETESGETVERFDIQAGSGFLLPANERLFTSKGSVNLIDGIYLAHIKLELENTRRPMEATFPFYIEDGKARGGEVTPELRERLAMKSLGFIISPAILTFAMRPGARRTEAISLTNLTEEPITVLPRCADWFRTPSSIDLVAYENPPHGHSAANVLTVSPPEVVLPPNGHRRVTVQALVPPGARGERYAAVCFERADWERKVEPRARTRQSCLVRVQVERTQRPAAEVLNFSAIRNARGAYDLAVDFKNTGNVAFSPELSFLIRGADNTVADRVRVPEIPPFVQAGAEGLVKREYDKVLEPGRYTAEVTLRFDPDIPPLVERAKFEVPGSNNVRQGEETPQ